MIDYVLSITGTGFFGEKVAYVGHSMGTTIMFHLASQRPDYVEENVSTVIALAPALTVTNVSAPLIKALLPAQDGLFRMFERIGMYSFGVPSYLQDFSIYLLCDTMPFICKYALLMIASDDVSLSDPVSY